jgi:lipopolysaccharide export system protein LptC
MAAMLAPPQAPAKRRRPVPLLWRLQSLVSAYLPLFLMLALAGGTAWLVKNTPLADGLLEAPPPRHEPDYQMQGFSMERIGANGQLRGRVEGSEMRHFPDTDTLEIDSVKVRAIGLDGSLTLATAHRGISNSDGSDMQLFGDVLVQRFMVDAEGVPAATPQLIVRGEFLQALANTEQLRSHLPVTITYGGAELRTENFTYDHLHAKLNFSGHTNGRFELAPNGKARKGPAK